MLYTTRSQKLIVPTCMAAAESYSKITGKLAPFMI